MITFVRGTTLLAVLIALPGIAVCWNHLPKDLWSKSPSRPSVSKNERANFFRNDSEKSAMSFSVFSPESVYPALPEAPILPKVQTKFQETSVPIQPYRAFPDAAIQQVSWEHPPAESSQDFGYLGTRLEALGAAYYKLEKWGNRGELFRVSCFVPLLEDRTHAKHFQAIGSDVVTVMQTVIADIEKWKNTR